MRLSPLYRTVLAIAAPSVVELLLTSLTHLVDTIMVGRLGAYAISAVGLTTQPKFIMLAMFVALNVGSTALVARRYACSVAARYSAASRTQRMLSGIAATGGAGPAAGAGSGAAD
ncbi:MAG TPA: MATE family efflux transporter, partial [Spirochaetales bacterium]|nr:MATE family efflux transporter [Spirochaetales bacterium]